MIKILIVEDEEPINNLIRMNLTKAGYQCKCAFDGQEAADMMAAEKFDLFLLDIMLPKINGYELLEYAQTLNTPVIFITAMGTVENKVKGLKKGADDYISKPFEIVELLARVETVLRRYNKAEKIIKILDIEVDTESRTVMQNGQQVILTLKEFELLLLFIRNKNIALYRQRAELQGEQLPRSLTLRQGILRSGVPRYFYGRVSHHRRTIRLCAEADR